MTDTMKAVRFHEYGGPEVLVLEQVPKPVPGPGQVLIRIHAASVNPIDWKLRSGALQVFMPLQLPAMNGHDLAGVVEAVGDGVVGLHPGSEVFAMMGATGGGAYAEYAVMDEAAVALKPRSLDFNQAAAVPMGALTSWQAVVGVGGLKAGDRLFVHAAGGNIGGMAVQIAHALGAHVTAAASTDAIERVKGYGADQVVDYRAGPFEDAVHDQDVVFDTLGGEMQARTWGVLKPGGILVSAVSLDTTGQALAHGVRAERMSATPNGEQLARVATMIDAGQVGPYMGAVLTLEQAAEAQELNRTGKVKGKIVLSVA